MLRILLLVFVLAAQGAVAEDRLVGIATRPGVKVGYWWMERPDAKATIVLLPGGEGGIGMKQGTPHSQNFLVRSRDFFAEAGYNVAVVGKTQRQGSARSALSRGRGAYGGPACRDRQARGTRQTRVARGYQPRHHLSRRCRFDATANAARGQSCSRRASPRPAVQPHSRCRCCRSTRYECLSW